MRFPPSFIERLRTHQLISEVIGKRVRIKKHGREFHALCPFHNEKTPSFTINDEKAFFHCFGCGAHGDAIEFIRRYERLTYPEAIERLAADGGLPLPKPDAETARKIEQHKTLFDVTEAACKWFETQLMATAGISGRDYILSRGLNDKTLRDWRIGFAPDSKSALHAHLNALGFGAKLQAEAGLIITPESGQAYDRFRGRVIFPIRNVSGKVIAFGGRLLPELSGNKHLPKYLNSPETELFKKGEMLYNLDLAKRSARETNSIIVMEGYMDVVAVGQAGVANAVATLGTAVTPEHLRLLWQLVREPILCLDGDMAGKRAMLRAAEIALPLLKPGQSIRFAILPKGEDPDSYIGKHGRANFERLLQSAKRLSETLWDVTSAQTNFALPEGRAALDGHLASLAKRIEDATVRQHYQDFFKRQMWERSAHFANKKSGPQKNKPRSAHIEHMAASHQTAALEKIIHGMLALIWQAPGILHKSQVEEIISHLNIRSPNLIAVRDSFLGSLHLPDSEDETCFRSHVKTRLPEDVQKLLGPNSLNLPFAANMTARDAELLWNELATAYHIAHLELELADLKNSINGAMDEASYRRLVELQSEVAKAQAARRFSTEPAEDA